MSWNFSLFLTPVHVNIYVAELACVFLCFLYSLNYNFSENLQIMKFSPESVAAFIAVLGILSIIAQVSWCVSYVIESDHI